MPVVRIEMLAGRSAEVKQALAAEVTNAVARHCQSDPAHIYVIFEDVPRQNWAVAGKLFAAPAPEAHG